MTLAALGLFVASAGTAAAVIGAAVAAARLIERLHNGTLRLDGAAVSDALAILGGAGVLAQAASAMRLQRLGKAFVMMEEGGASVTELQKAATGDSSSGAGRAGEAGGGRQRGHQLRRPRLGNLTFLDQMMDIAAQEAAGSMTHAEARRQRAMAIGGAVNNDAMFVAGNAIKAHEQAQAGKKGGGAPPREGGTGGGTHEGGGGGTQKVEPAAERKAAPGRRRRAAPGSRRAEAHAVRAARRVRRSPRARAAPLRSRAAVPAARRSPRAATRRRGRGRRGWRAG